MNGKVRYFLPSYAEWWEQRGHGLVPTVVLRCGIESCGRTVGAVMVDGDRVLALIHQKHPDRTVPYTPRQTEETLGLPPGTRLPDLARQQDRKFEALDRETLRYLDGDKRRAKRYDAGSVLMPLEAFGFIVCPEHGWRDLPDAEATEANLRAFIAETRHASQRRYNVFGGNKR